MDNNICKFVPTRSSADQINTVNFVYETVIPQRNQFITKSTYMMYLVTEGRGRLCHTQKSSDIAKGDLFFTFPSTPFAIEVSDSNLNYLYISFLGIRAGRILEELKIRPGNCVFHGYDALEDFWMDALDRTTPYNLDMLSESVLLYTLSVVSNNTIKEEKLSKTADNILKIKKYIDDHYTSPDLSLETICAEYQYNRKYLSEALKKVLHVGFSEYLRTLRIQHACMLVGEGLSNIKDIAALSGYRDPLYFSKVFKSVMLLSPKDYIAGIRAERGQPGLPARLQTPSV